MNFFGGPYHGPYTDTSKAYDKVDRGYLEAIMSQMGFHKKWVGWMMLCVKTVQYSVAVNGEVVGPIFPGRGLRQGDPLSSYMFILCAKGLSSLIHNAISRGDIHGATICRNALTVSHLLFVDDFMLLFRANQAESQKMKDILVTYERALGQSINYNESEIFSARILILTIQ